MEKIMLNNKFPIDLEKLLETRLLVQANSGGGKSWLIRRLLEQSHGQVQQIVIDLEGEFSTLREKYDYILVGKDGDTSADPKSAALLAKKLLELGASAIIDLYELKHDDRKRFVKLFLDSMVNAPKELWHPVLVVIDEAHVFAPEKGQSEALGSVIDLATRGRKRGYCIVLATQRISKLHKDAAAECNNKLIGRTGLDIDMKRASEELGFTSKEQMLSLRALESGEFFAFGTAISNTIEKIKIGEVKTSHPKVGSRALIAPIPASNKIKKIISQLSDLPQQAEKELKTTMDLQNEIAQLKRQITIQKPIIDPKEIQRKVQEAIIQVSLEHKQDLNQILDISLKLADIFGTFTDVLNTIIGKNKELTTKQVFTFVNPKRPANFIVNENIKKDTVNISSGDYTEKPIQGGALRMLKVLVSRYPIQLTKSQLGTFSKMKPRGGSFNTYMSTLKSQNYIIQSNDLIQATQKGIDFIGETPNPPQTSAEIIQMWQDNLTGGARKIFDILINSYPNPLTKESLGEQIDMVYTGGSFNTYLSILRSNNLIEAVNGNIIASKNLFEV